MTWIFSLSAECGADENAAQVFAAHFNGFVVQRSTGFTHSCKTHTFFDKEAWWAMIAPDGVSESGVVNDTDRQEMVEISHILYDRLRSAPKFRCALVGVEVDEFRNMNEIECDGVEAVDFDGVVVSEVVWRMAGQPGHFVQFSAGYRWRPFRGDNL